MLIRHLALSVSDPRKSRDFYLNTVGLDGQARDEPWVVRIPSRRLHARVDQGRAATGGTRDTVHFGCALATRDEARATRDRLRRAGVTEIEWEDEGDYSGVKVQDPDGYVVELAYDEA
jgi:catechol 2,3-dioxygenase-like lactoylglutathione lyase family enzyme